MNNPAFDYLRQFKKVSDENEELALKTIKRKYPNLSTNDLVDIFEKGLTGEYGKVYSADAETILDWIKESQKRKDNTTSYYESGLISPSVKVTDANYPSGYEDWHKEVNKAFTKFLGGVNESNFHPHIYDRLMCDNKIPMHSYQKYLNGSVDSAKQRYLKDYFNECKLKGWNQIYTIRN